MIPAIGTPTSNPPYATGGAALQGQLARYERELSACVNCSTAKTTEGKQKIQEVSSQIEQIKARIEQATQTRVTRQAEKILDTGAQRLSTIGSQIDVKVLLVVKYDGPLTPHRRSSAQRNRLY